MIETITDVSDHPSGLSDLFSRQKSFFDIFQKYEKLGITYTEPQNGGSINVQTAYNDRVKLSGVQITLNPASH